ncbi:NlpC/P60 family protein [Streptomyces sp. JNUCC 64]
MSGPLPHRAPARRRRAARAAVTVLAAVALAAPWGPSGAALALPAPPERPVSALLTDLQRLYREAGAAADRFHATEELLTRRRGEVGSLQTRLADARGALRASRNAAGLLARRQYRDGDALSPYLRLLTGRDPLRALAERHALDRAARHWTATVERLAADERHTAVLAGRARAALDEQQVLTERRRAAREEVDERLDEVEELLASLTAGQLAELARLETAAATGTGAGGEAEVGGEAGVEGEAGTGTGSMSGAGGLPAAGPPAAGPPGAPAASRAPSAGGAAALRYAVAQIGKPYVWGAEGPGTFDCSGLTSRAWAVAGTTLPRTSQEQWRTLTRVPLDALRPGDLVVYFPGATHVGIYLGDGSVVHAPRPGGRVKVSPVTANPVLGAVRPDPSAGPLARYTPPVLPKGARDGSDTGYDGSATAPADG